MIDAKKSVKSADKTDVDAIALLTADHKAVQAQFKAFDKLQGEDSVNDEKKNRIVAEVCLALTIHAQIEEEIFYPAVHEAVGDELMNEALVEHMGAKDTIAQLQSMSPDEELYDARFTVLGEYVAHHIEEEQNEIFPKVKKAKIDTAALGVELQQRKLELEAESSVRNEAVTKIVKSSAPARAVHRPR